jgi:hypothetical protein
MFSEYVLDSNSVERRVRRQIVLCPVKVVSATYIAVFNGSAFSTSVPDTGTYTVNSD